MTFIQFIILGLAVWRISSLFVNESGPLSLFQRIRELAGIQHDPDGVPYQYPDNFFAELLSCIWCTSIWVGGGVMALWLFFPQPTYIAATALAFSTVSIWLESNIRGGVAK